MLEARYARRNLTGITAKRTAVSHGVGGSLRSYSRNFQHKPTLYPTQLNSLNTNQPIPTQSDPSQANPTQPYPTQPNPLAVPLPRQSHILGLIFQKLCDSTSNGTDQYLNGSSNLLTTYIESSLDRLGLLSPTHNQQRSQQQTGQITFQPVLINKSKFLKATHCTKIRKIEIPRSLVVEALSWLSRRASQHPAVQSPVHP